LAFDIGADNRIDTPLEMQRVDYASDGVWVCIIELGNSVYRFRAERIAHRHRSSISHYKDPSPYSAQRAQYIVAGAPIVADQNDIQAWSRKPANGRRRKKLGDRLSGACWIKLEANDPLLPQAGSGIRLPAPRRP
jgi:hypothetical protein